ncbi:hypothetical protein ACFY6U_34325 [Streptomyces sp. NPDC013157]|uniref:hypothetical protein n=1 Tax=Streptomyces sp. NPDC013157 TaxID=3364861 RepID=UPI0036C26F50
MITGRGPQKLATPGRASLSAQGTTHTMGVDPVGLAASGRQTDTFTVAAYGELHDDGLVPAREDLDEYW